MKRIRMIPLGLGVLLIFLLVGVAWAGSSDNYAIDWQVMSGGGASASSPGWVTLNGSLGQTAIGPLANGDESVKLGAGYWSSVVSGEPPLTQFIFLPVVVRDR
jgi:hypothetical protein